MNHTDRPRPRPLTPFIVADALGLGPAVAAVAAQQAVAPAQVGPALPARAEPAAARTPCPALRRPGELVWASPP